MQMSCRPSPSPALLQVDAEIKTITDRDIRCHMSIHILLDCGHVCSCCDFKAIYIRQLKPVISSWKNRTWYRKAAWKYRTRPPPTDRWVIGLTATLLSTVLDYHDTLCMGGFLDPILNYNYSTSATACYRGVFHFLWFGNIIVYTDLLHFGSFWVCEQLLFSYHYVNFVVWLKTLF